MTALGIASGVRELARTERGATALEFAVTAPLVVALLVTVVDLCLLLVGGAALDAGARAAARYGLTGFVEAGIPRESRIVDILTRHVCPAASSDGTSAVCFWTLEGLPTDHRAEGALLVVEAKAYADPQNVGQAEPFTDANGNGVADAGEYTDINGNGQWDEDMGRSGAGGANDVVVYEIAMSQRVLTPMLQAALGGTILHRARMVVRNEPF